MKRERKSLEEEPFIVRKDDPLEDTLWELCSEIPMLEQLSLAHCFFRKRSLKYTPRNLVKIDLSDAYGFNGGGMAFLPRTITHIRLDRTDITDYSIQCLPKSVLYLSVRQCPNITSVTIKCLPPNLKVLLIENNKKITNQAIRNLPETLETLSLVKCKQITDSILRTLPPNLVELCVTGSRKIPADELSSWAIERGVQILASIPIFSLDMMSLSNFEEMNNRDDLRREDNSQTLSKKLKPTEEEKTAPYCTIPRYSVFDPFSPLQPPFEEIESWLNTNNTL